MLLSVLFLLLADAARVETGAIYVRTEPGVLISMDGLPAGTTTRAESGKRISSVPAGTHVLELAVPGGGSMTKTVEVELGRTTTLAISSLTLRASSRRSRASLEIQFSAAHAPCRALVGDKEETTSTSTILMSDVQPGKQKVQVFCIGQSVEQIVELIPDRTVIIRADFVAKTLVVTGNRPRVTALKILASNDWVADAPIHANAKRALFATLTSSIVALQISADGTHGIRGTFRAPNPNAAASFVERLKHRAEVTSIEVGRFEYEGDHMIIEIDLVVSD